jgi:hypothetical protein
MKIVNLELQLPSDLPPGEKVLWFGRPQTFSLLRRAYRADFVALYFAMLAVWAAVEGSINGVLAAFAAASVALGLLALLAFMTARTTLYFITNRRVVIRVGVAMTMFHNLPFGQIQSAALRAFADGTGDVAVKPVAGQRVSYWSLWPCARPLRLRDPEPALRAVADAREVARVLSRAMIEANGGHASAPAAARNAAPALTHPATV